MTARRVRFDIRQAGKPLLAILIVWLLACAGTYFLMVRPKVREFVSLEKGTAPERQELQLHRQEVERRELYLGALRKAERDLGTLRTDVLSTRAQRMVNVQLELERLCAQFSIELESVSFENPILLEEGLDKHVMIVPLEGGYANLRKFLQAVEDSDRFLLVERVALGEGREGGVILQLKITLATYFDLDSSASTEQDV